MASTATPIKPELLRTLPSDAHARSNGDLPTATTCRCWCNRRER
jgi:hypothetical protein